MAEFININWNSVLSVDKVNPVLSYDKFIKKANEIIDKYFPLKKLSKKGLKIQQNPGLPLG